ncbi:MAG: hypothetical protein SFX73_26300 [Kofleriaceae bacterium]|nr:hypothetical protein [Kofleriaceae bacterium]
MIAHHISSMQWRGAEVPARIVRAEHLVLALVILIVGAVGLLLARATRPAPEPRIPWPVARQRTEAAPADVWMFRATRGGRVALAIEDELRRAGAVWWSRRERAWLVAGLAPATLHAIARNAAGMIVGVAAASAAPVRTNAVGDGHHRFDLVRPIPSTLGEWQLQRCWSALVLHLGGSRSYGGVAISDMRFEGEALVGFTARLRDHKRPADP